MLPRYFCGQFTPSALWLSCAHLRARAANTHTQRECGIPRPNDTGEIGTRLEEITGQIESFFSGGTRGGEIRPNRPFINGEGLTDRIISDTDMDGFDD